MISPLNFILENVRHILYKNLRYFIISYFNQVSERKDLKSRYFVSIGPKMGPHGIKVMYSMSYIHTIFHRTYIHLTCSGS